MEKGLVVSLNISERKGTKKRPVKEVTITRTGIEGDAHSGDWHRQVSLLADESVDKMRKVHKDISPGDFAENITTCGLNLMEMPMGQRLMVGEAELEVSQIGKECHMGCEIRNLVGDCVMPREGIFTKVVRPGRVAVGDHIVLIR